MNDTVTAAFANISTLLDRGDALAAQGKARAVVAFYTEALKQASQHEAWPPGFAERLAVARDTCTHFAGRYADFLQQQLAGIGFDRARSSRRFAESLDIVLGRKQPYVQQPRFYLFPGMGHCGSGLGPNTFDVLSPMMSWVETGTAPYALVANNATTGVSRPVYPYPTVARYVGSSSTNDAANFKPHTPKKKSDVKVTNAGDYLYSADFPAGALHCAGHADRLRHRRLSGREQTSAGGNQPLGLGDKPPLCQRLAHPLRRRTQAVVVVPLRRPDHHQRAAEAPVQFEHRHCH